MSVAKKANPVEQLLLVENSKIIAKHNIIPLLKAKSNRTAGNIKITKGSG